MVSLPNLIAQCSVMDSLKSFTINLENVLYVCVCVCKYSFFFPGTTQPIVGVYFTALCRALASSRTRLLDHIQRRATVGRTPLNE